MMMMPSTSRFSLILNCSTVQKCSLLQGRFAFQQFSLVQIGLGIFICSNGCQSCYEPFHLVSSSLSEANEPNYNIPSVPICSCKNCIALYQYKYFKPYFVKYNFFFFFVSGIKTIRESLFYTKLYRERRHSLEGECLP